MGKQGREGEQWLELYAQHAYCSAAGSQYCSSGSCVPCNPGIGTSPVAWGIWDIATTYSDIQDDTSVLAAHPHNSVLIASLPNVLPNPVV